MSFYLLNTLSSCFLFAASYIIGGDILGSIQSRTIYVFFLVIFSVTVTASGILFTFFISKLAASIVLAIIGYVVEIVF